MARWCKCGAWVEKTCHKCRDATRGTTAERGYDHRWRKLSERIRTADRPLCELCLKSGKSTPAEHGHHIIPIAERPDLRLDPKNVMSLCTACHEKVEAEKNGQTS